MSIAGSKGAARLSLRHCGEKKPGPARTPARAWRWSVLARQVDHVDGEVQGDFIQREISVLDFLGEHDIAVAIVARKRGGSGGAPFTYPPRLPHAIAPRAGAMGAPVRSGLWQNRTRFLEKRGK